MYKKILVITIVTVSARNVQRDNIRDVYLPETKLDFDTPYTNNGRRLEHDLVRSIPEVKSINGFEDHGRQDSQFSLSNRDRNSNGHGSDHRRTFEGFSRDHDQNTEGIFENRELNREIERETQGFRQQEFGHSSVRSIDQRANHRNTYDQFDQNTEHGSQNFGSINQHSSGFGPHDFQQNFDSKNFENQHRAGEFGSHGFAQNIDSKNLESHRTTNTNTHFHQNNENVRSNAQNHDSSRAREEQNLKNLGIQIQENERRLDSISTLNQQNFQTNRNEYQNQQSAKQGHETLGHTSVSDNRQNHAAETSRIHQEPNRHRSEGHHESEGHSNRNQERHRDTTTQERGHQNENEQDKHNKHQTNQNPRPSSNVSTQSHRNNHDQNERPEQHDIESSNNRSTNTGGVKSKHTGKLPENEVLRSNSNGQGSEEEDRWIWGSASENRTDFSTVVPETVTLDDRAAFTGDKCPTGKIRVGNMCVDPD